MPSPTQEAEAARLRRLAELGADLSGRVPAVALSLALGPPGAAIGAGLGWAVAAGLKRAGAELTARMLGPREHARIGAAWMWADERCYEYLMTENLHPRDDGFFDEESPRRRSPSDEVIEGVLLAAGREYEERKVRFMGYLYAGIAFDDSVDRSLAARLIRTAQDLSYRELALLSLVGQKGRFDLPTEDQYERNRPQNWTEWAVRNDLARIGWGQAELVNPERDGAAGIREPGAPALPSRVPRSPSRQALDGYGLLLFELMDLDRVDEQELVDLAALLRTSASTDE